MKVATAGAQHEFDVHVYFADLDPALVRVELDAEREGESAPVRQEMKRVRQGPGADTYHAHVPAPRPATDYTARLLPRHDGVATPLEAAHIRWQR